MIWSAILISGDPFSLSIPIFITSNPYPSINKNIAIAMISPIIPTIPKPTLLSCPAAIALAPVTPKTNAAIMPKTI